MPSPSDEPLRRVHINLFAADVDAFESRYGRGWTEQVRLLVRQNQRAYESLKATLDQAKEDDHGK